MTTNVRRILVPYDYTELSDNAIKHAIILAKIIEAEIVLLHIVDDLSEESRHLKRLQEIAEQTIQKYNVNVEVKVRPGVVHKVIKVVAETLDAFLVIMKTQPPRGSEKFLRSRSIKVMMGSKIPFIVVQSPPKRLSFRKVIFPIDFRKENKEKLVWISTLSKYYTSKIYLFKPNTSDYKIRANLEFSKRFLEGKNIDYEIITAEKGKSLTESSIDFAQKVDAQLIIIMLHKNIGRFSNLLGLNEQKFISNKHKIPVMVLNPKIELHKYGGFY
ncbi:MAG: universal stress protein [Bacteroidales bacterium]|nr:universal stress protein [Bacteroidales bacterium]